MAETVISFDEARTIRAIKAHIEKGDKAHEKAEQHYVAAGQHLKDLKGSTANWAEWETLLKSKVQISTGRASELMQIADGRKTVGELRAGTAKRVAQHRESSLRNEEQRHDDLESQEPDDDGHHYQEGYQSPWEAHGVPPPEDPENYRTAYLIRADQARKFAFYSGPVNDETVAMARAVVTAWETLVRKMEQEL